MQLIGTILVRPHTHSRIFLKSLMAHCSYKSNMLLFSSGVTGINLRSRRNPSVSTTIQRRCRALKYSPSCSHPASFYIPWGQGWARLESGNESGESTMGALDPTPKFAIRALTESSRVIINVVSEDITNHRMYLRTTNNIEYVSEVL